MSRPLLLGLLAGAALGAGATLLLVSPAAPLVAPPATAPPSADALEKAMTRSLRGVEAELHGIRDAIGDRAVPAEDAPAPGAVDSRARGEQPAARPSRGAAPRVRDEREPEGAPQPQYDRVRSLKDDQARRKWTLAREDDVLGWFGAPDRIVRVAAGEEQWWYLVPTGGTREDGRPETEVTNFLFSEGRLRRVE